MAEPDRDDLPVGRLLSRREALTVLGASGLVLLSGGTPQARAWAAPGRGVPACVARPEQTEGPYFVDEMLNRSDIRSDPGSGVLKEGTPLDLTLAVSAIREGSCAPLAGAHVDIWHCDATGVYSGVQDPGFDTRGQSFLRGYQITNEAGEARFRTIYPGWYSGRTVHIHFKVRTDPKAAQGHEFTSQLYFDDALTTRVFARMPYAAKTGRRDLNADDSIFARGGDQLMVAPKVAGDGYAARFELGLQVG
jgi:protocatechuate 3,4-dioxygenase beta subunit